MIKHIQKLAAQNVNANHIATMLKMSGKRVHATNAYYFVKDVAFYQSKDGVIVGDIDTIRAQTSH